MPALKASAVAVLAAASISACGTTAKPVAGSPQATAAARKRIDDPVKKHIQCLQSEHIAVRREQIGGYPGFQVGVRPAGPTVLFQPTPGAAQTQAIMGQAQGAEAIGSALLYPNHTPNMLLSEVESCVELGVQG